MARKTICNMCGKEFDEWDAQEQFNFRNPVWFGSRFDEQIIDCDLCCSCFDKMMEEYILPNCKINPIIGRYDEH